MALTAKRPSKSQDPSNQVSELEQLKAAVQEPEAEPLKRLNVNIPQSVFNRFKAKAAQEGKTMSDVVLKHVNEYLSK
ncbi:MAG: hypothetical protein CL610_19790 [Anaerolineaceae bacterium]|nr:hypothetical protein [Anaerolineaceae bacterium]